MLLNKGYSRKVSASSLVNERDLNTAYYVLIYSFAYE